MNRKKLLPVAAKTLGCRISGVSIAISITICLLLPVGCGSDNTQTEKPGADPLAQASADALTPDPGADEAVQDSGDAPDEQQDEGEKAKKEEKGHFSFQPVVISSVFREIMGEDMCEAYRNYVDAALKGENEFAVKDEETYDWMIGQFPGVCFPVLEEYTESDYASAYHDGKATFHYTIPQSEFAQKEAEFEDIVTGILNETMRDDYSELEKVIALYEYFCTKYTYDYEVYAEMGERYVEETSAYRFLTTDQGICSECAPAFSCLLLQAGVDATTAGGNCPINGEGHVWSYVTIGGKNYHVDPTYGMESGVCLSYFMMTDEQREKEDEYQKDEMCVGSHYKDEHNGDQYDADDDSFAPLWGGYLTSWDPEKNLICYIDKSGKEAVFNYSFFEQ